MPELTRAGGGMPGPTEPTHVAAFAGGAATSEATSTSVARTRLTSGQLCERRAVTRTLAAVTRSATRAVLSPAFRLVFRLEIANRPGMLARKTATPEP
jgi:hypothetical protein